MESDLPTPIDDSLPFQPRREEDEPQQQQYYYTQPPPPPPVEYFYHHPQEKSTKSDIFSELGRIHWIIFISSLLLAFFMGKSISTPIIIRST